MKTLKVLLQEVVSGIKAWVNSNFAQESNTVHKTGNETVNGIKTFNDGVIGMKTSYFARDFKGTDYEMTASDFYGKFGFFKISGFKANTVSAPRGNDGDYDLVGMSTNTGYGTYLCTTPRNNLLWYGKFWDSVWQGWHEVVNCENTQTITGEKTFGRNILSKNYNYSRGTIPSTNQYSSLIFTDNSNNGSARLLRWFNADGYNGITLQSWDAQLTTDISERFQLQYDPSGNGQAVLGGNNFKEFVPLTSNSIDLGTSTYKWKTLNGINPGSLSLPDFSAEYNVSGEIVPPTGEDKISINWGKNTFTPTVSGWLSIRIHKATFIKIYREARASYCFAARIDSVDDICVCSPVVAGVEYTIKILATQFSPDYDHFRLSPCLGNV